MDDQWWDRWPRLLQDLCEGHPAYAVELYGLDLPNGVRTWLCKGCFLPVWIDLGRPDPPGRTA